MSEYDTPLYVAIVCNGRHNSIVTGVTNKLLVPNGLVLLKRTIVLECGMMEE